MSYSLKVLQDNPIGFWKLDDVAVNPVFNFNDILENFDTYQDLLDNYEQYQYINYEATDSSGCQNTGTYVGDFNNPIKHFPLSPGGEHSLEINSERYIIFPIANSYYKENVSSQFGTQNSWSKSFTLECWVDIEINTDSLTNIFADEDNSIGIFYQNKNIIFKLDTQSLTYTLPFINKVIHVVCVYNINSASIYIDGVLVVSKNIDSNPFTNEEIQLKTGPSKDLEDTFIIDDIALYRYALSANQIKNHYLNQSYTSPTQIVLPDNGELFEFYDTEISKVFTYSYPYNKSWEYFTNSDLFYNRVENYISLNKTESQESKNIYLNDIITLPAGLEIDSSKIEWFGETGIIVRTSLDGINYEECVNGEAIPQYKYSNFNESRFFYIQIELVSSDTSKYLPYLYSLSVNFYNQQIMYSKNGSSYISKIEDLDFYLGQNKYPILQKDSRNGIKVPSNSGFNINIPYQAKSIEFFYTPLESISGSLLIKTSSNPTGAASEFSWNANGSLNKTNIESIYVNGEEATAETNISNIFISNNLHHVVINFTEAISELAIINYKSSGSIKSLYQYLSIYYENLDFNKIINHYNLYSSKNQYQTKAAYISMSENSVNIYNNDWIVVQNS